TDGRAGGHAADRALRRDDLRELHLALEARRIPRRIDLEPDPVDVQARIRAPLESLERAARALDEVAARPRAGREARSEVTDLGAVQPDRMLAVRLRRVVELDHLLNAHPLSGRRGDRRVVQQVVAPVVAVAGEAHAGPVVIVIETARRAILLGRRAESIVAGWLEAGLWIRVVDRRIVAAHPDAAVLVEAARRVLDVVPDVERVGNGRRQLPVEMAAVVHA